MRARHQTDAVQQLRDAGYEITYCDAWLPPVLNDWLVENIGIDFVLCPQTVWAFPDNSEDAGHSVYGKIPKCVSIADPSALIVLDDIRSLEVVNLSGTQITDQEIAYLRNLPRLRVLDVSRTKITDASIDIIGNLDTLEVLVIRHTDVSDASIDTLSGLGTLKQLSIEYSRISEDGRAVIQGAIPGLLINPPYDTPFGDTILFPTVRPCFSGRIKGDGKIKEELKDGSRCFARFTDFESGENIEAKIKIGSTTLATIETVHVTQEPDNTASCTIRCETKNLDD